MLTVLQGGSLGYARDDDGAKCYQNSAALRSFDSVLIFQISHFLTYDVFLRSDDEMRRTTTPHSSLESAKLSYAIKG